MKRLMAFDTMCLKKKSSQSVTTILDQTQSAEKRESLQRWRERVGEAEATRIVDKSQTRGTAMHKILKNIF